MKVAKKPDLAMCEEACKMFCDKQLDDHEEYVVPPTKDGAIIWHQTVASDSNYENSHFRTLS